MTNVMEPTITITADTRLVMFTEDGTDQDLVSSFLGSGSAIEYAEIEAAEHNGVAAICAMCEDYIADGSVCLEGDEMDEEIYTPAGYLSQEMFTPQMAHDAIMAQAARDAG